MNAYKNAQRSSNLSVHLGAPHEMVGSSKEDSPDKIPKER